jgi:hypothetical protein
VAITSAFLVTRFAPTFAAIDVGIIDSAIEEATRMVDPDWFGARADDAILHLAAHLALTGAGNLAGGVQSVSAGSVSVTYAAASTPYGGTSYGRHYEFLVRLSGPGARVL